MFWAGHSFEVVIQLLPNTLPTPRRDDADVVAHEACNFIQLQPKEIRIVHAVALCERAILNHGPGACSHHMRAFLDARYFLRSAAY